LDKRTGKTASNGVIYSLILRLRGTFIIHQLLKNKTYSNGLFRKWVTSRYKGDYDELYEIYRKIRDEKEIKDKIPIKDAEILLKLLKEEIQRMGGIIADYGK